MVFTFLAAQGKEIGKSLVENDLIDTVKELIIRAEKLGVKFLLPIDIVVASEFSADSLPTTVDSDQIPPDQMGLDIGPRSAENFAREIKLCKTVFWNGPMGVFEFTNFSYGTKVIAQALTQVMILAKCGRMLQDGKLEINGDRLVGMFLTLMDTELNKLMQQ